MAAAIDLDGGAWTSRFQPLFRLPIRIQAWFAESKLI
jgi:hypothetical protein